MNTLQQPLSSNPSYRSRSSSWQTITKVPKLTGYFWAIKILTTAMGEATSDFLALKFGPIPAVTIGAIALLIAFIIQFKSPRYKAWPYWFTVAMVSVFGTMAADGLHVELGVPYIVSTIFFIIVLTLILIIWHRSEGTLSIHSIYTPRREFFYWATVLATFALGTAAGDLTATTLGLGYLSSGILFGIIFLIPALFFWIFRSRPIFSFWFAYILTRPLGASFADWFGVSKHAGGLNFGRGTVAIFLSIIIIILVSYLAISRKDAQSTRST